MKVIFLGVGEPWDEYLHNVSLFVEGKANILLDCGFDTYKSVFRYLFERRKDSDYMDAVYISHFHGDHDAGISPLLSMLWVYDRSKPLTIMGQNGIEERVMNLIKISFPELLGILNQKYDLEFIETESPIEYKGLKLDFARTEHSTKNLAIRIDEDGKSLCYSGDGALTKDSINLYKGCDFLIHDAYLFERNGILETTGHGDMVGLIKMAEENKIKELAFVHVEKSIFNRGEHMILNKLEPKKVKVFFPREGKEIIL